MEETKINILEITFEGRDNLILLENEFTNMLDLSKKLCFSLKEKWLIKRKKISVKDFPRNEWEG